MTRVVAIPLASILAVVLLALAGLAVATAQASDPDVSPFYDSNGNGVIDRDEAITAVADYFAGVITRDQVLVIIQYYFSGEAVPDIEDILPDEPPTRSLRDVIEDVRPAVVYVWNLGAGRGSGVIFRTEGETGYVMTNSHVVEDREEGLRVRTDDGEWYDATLLRADPMRDLAVVTICCDDFTAVDFAEPEDVAVGDDVVVMGYPGPLLFDTATVTKGIVSAFRYRWNRASIILQTDAATNPGNSGGPILSTDGLVAGIIHSGYEEGFDGRPRRGLNFGAAVVTIREQMESLMTPGGEFIFEGISGSIRHRDGDRSLTQRFFDLSYSDGRADVELETTFTNPYSASTQLWSYGLTVRYDPDGQDEEHLPHVKFVIDSQRNWTVSKVAYEDPYYTDLAEGNASNIKTGNGETNHIKVKAVADTAQLYINGQQVEGNIDISSVPHPGDIGVFTGYWKGSARAGAVTEFENLRGKLLDQ